MNQVVSLNSVALPRCIDEDDASSVLTDDTRSEYTHCSIVSCISLTQTVSNNVGAGRTLDNYFFQPVGKAIESALSKVVAKRQIRRAGQVILDVFNSARSQIPDDGFHLSHRWLGDISLTGLLFIWGGLNGVPGWDKEMVAYHCGILTSAMGHPSPSIRAAAVEKVLSLTDEAPRLYTFFDQSSFEKEKEPIWPSTPGDAFERHLKGNILLHDSVNKTRMTLRRLSNSIPDMLLSKENLHAYRPSLLSFLADALDGNL
ncbi:hypothetical protein DFH11DRAFT_1293296 [Phellopilus nigrolimitatus]|nr:hypothetical protein DFH11DRAFT_1293296 [Phellopilus nigrolimitatus]